MAEPLDHSFRVVTNSPEKTETLGERLAALVPIGGVVALRGELAAGKTCFVRGMARHFGVAEDVGSPTFTIVNEYGANPRLYHLDLYRISGVNQLVDVGIEELFAPEDGITVVEWAERAESLLPQRRLDIHLEHAGHDCRRIAFTNLELLADGWSDALTNHGEYGDS